jgi:hypothetical protein
MPFHLCLRISHRLLFGLLTALRLPILPVKMVGR